MERCVPPSRGKETGRRVHVNPKLLSSALFSCEFGRGASRARDRLLGSNK